MVLFMNQAELEATIPIALAELHANGIYQVFVDQLGQQVTRHDETYLSRRNAVRGFLGKVGINIPELPNGRMRPLPHKMHPALTRLEDAGVIVGEFEIAPVDGQKRRRLYSLAPEVDD